MTHECTEVRGEQGGSKPSRRALRPGGKKIKPSDITAVFAESEGVGYQAGKMPPPGSLGTAQNPHTTPTLQFLKTRESWPHQGYEKEENRQGEARTYQDRGSSGASSERGNGP